MFFVVGSARSGTTLLRMMLNAHPEVAVPPESRFIIELHRGRGEVDVASWLEELEGHPRFDAWDLPIDAVAAQLEGRDRVAYATANEAAYRAFAAARGKSRYGDKTPRYITHVELLAKLWPEGRFVHMVRDGREVALSYADVPFGPNTLAKAAVLWSERVGEGMKAGRALPEGRYMELRYELLLDDPERETRNLCEFLDVDFNAAMLDYSDRARGEVLERAHRYNPNVTKRIGRTRSWREDMPPARIEVFEAVAGDTLSALGYERVFPAPGPRARLRARLGRLGLPLDRLSQKASSHT